MEDRANRLIANPMIAVGFPQTVKRKPHLHA